MERHVQSASRRLLNSRLCKKKYEKGVCGKAMPFFVWTKTGLKRGKGVKESKGEKWGDGFLITGVDLWGGWDWLIWRF